MRNLHAASVSSLSHSRPCSAFGLRSHWVDLPRVPHRRIQCGRCVRNLSDYRSLIYRCAGVDGVVARANAAAGNSRRTIVTKFHLWMPFSVPTSCRTACGQSCCEILWWLGCRAGWCCHWEWHYHFRPDWCLLRAWGARSFFSYKKNKTKKKRINILPLVNLLQKVRKAQRRTIYFVL